MPRPHGLLIAAICVLRLGVWGHQAMLEPACFFNPPDHGPINTVQHTYCGADIPDPASAEPSATFEAGSVQEILFQNQNIDPSNEAQRPADQARHGGGFCEFSLSYDAGSSWHVIARYNHGCPDVFYTWQVLIPDDAPEGRAIFAFSWFPGSSGGPEMYMNCAFVDIVGGSGSPESFANKYCPMIEGNVPGVFDESIQPVPDSFGNASGDGPQADDVDRILNGGTITCEDGPKSFDELYQGGGGGGGGGPAPAGPIESEADAPIPPPGGPDVEASVESQEAFESSVEGSVTVNGSNFGEVSGQPLGLEVPQLPSVPGAPEVPQPPPFSDPAIGGQVFKRFPSPAERRLLRRGIVEFSS